MRRFVILVCALLLVGCAGAYKEFYKQYADPRTLADVEVLRDGEEPKVIRVNDLARERDIALSKGYRIVGESSFNGAPQSDTLASRQAKSVGATLVLVAAKYTNTQTVTTPLLLPNNQTTYSNGSVYGSGGYANYNGTSTTYGSTVVPMTSQVHRYDQDALFFVKSTARLRFGVQYASLTPELRAKYERNTGVVALIIIEGTPAFYANMLTGDVIVEVDGEAVVDQGQFATFVRNKPGGIWKVKILRNGAERVIEVAVPAS